MACLLCHVCAAGVAAQGKPTPEQKTGQQQAQAASGAADHVEQPPPKGNATEQPHKDVANAGGLGAGPSVTGGPKGDQGPPTAPPRESDRFKKVLPGAVVAFLLGGFVAWMQLVWKYRMFNGVQFEALACGMSAWLFIFVLAIPSSAWHAAIELLLSRMNVEGPEVTLAMLLVWSFAAAIFSGLLNVVLEKINELTGTAHLKGEGWILTRPLYYTMDGRCKDARTKVLKQIMRNYDWAVVRQSTHELVSDWHLSEKDADALRRAVDSVVVSNDGIENKLNKYKALVKVTEKISVGSLRRRVARNAIE